MALPTSGPFATAENILLVAEHAERCGFDDVWVNDHYSYPRERFGQSSAGSIDAVASTLDPNFFESLSTLAAVAGRLRRIGIAVHSLVMPLRDPRLLAKQLATISELSGRRLTIAPAIGGARDEYLVAGVPWERRGRILDEYLAVLDAVATNEHPMSFAGEQVSFENATLYPRPRNIRRWITGDGEAALERVVRSGTGWFSSGWARKGRAFYEGLQAQLDDKLRAAGRDPSTVARAIDPFLCVAETHEAAYAIGEASLARRYGSLETALAMSVIGSAAEAREQLRSLMASGCTYFEFRFICRDMPSYLGMIERVSADVIPDLRAR